MNVPQAMVTALWSTAALGLLTGKVRLDTPEKVQLWQTLNLLVASLLAAP